MSKGNREVDGPTVSRREFLQSTAWLLAAWAFPRLASAEAAHGAPAIEFREGTIPEAERITFEGALAGKGIEYRVKYLPPTCAEYGGTLYQVVPQAIWWHWDGGATPTTEDHDRVLSTWYGLAGRTKRGDPVAAHFAVGPNTILHMLPTSAKTVIQGRLTDDASLSDVLQAKSLGGVHIETTGRWYFKRPPLECQTATLVDLTIALMRQYTIPFRRICGHRERAAWNPKPDPGVEYLRDTRVRLLKALIARAQWPLIGHPSGWHFEMDVLRGGRVVRVANQTGAEIWSQLTEREARLINRHVLELSPPAREHPKYVQT